MTQRIICFDNVVMPPRHMYLATMDPQVINRLLIQVDDIKGLSGTILRMVEELLRKNHSIVQLIESKYHVE